MRALPLLIPLPVAATIALAGCSKEPAPAINCGTVAAGYGVGAINPGSPVPGYPALSGRVVDQANIIDDRTEADLVARLAALEARTCHQVVVATVTSLRGAPIETYARDLGNRWALGRKGINDGVLLLIAPNERKLRIEHGNGVNGKLTKDEGKLIIDHMAARFSKGEMSAGIAAGVAEIEAQLDDKAGSR